MILPVEDSSFLGASFASDIVQKDEVSNSGSGTEIEIMPGPERQDTERDEDYVREGEGINNRTVQLERIVVTFQRRPVESKTLSRSGVVIGSEEIEKLPVHSVEGILEYVQGMDVRKRGVFGIQSDLSIRGSTSEQVLVLLDGIKMNDSQTAHHNMDLPLCVDDIERIEVLRGGNCSLYGANAFSGVVNIITKRPEGKRIRFQNIGGEHQLSSQSLSVNTDMGFLSSRISVDRKKCSGYKPDTDFKNLSVYFNSLVNSLPLPVDLKVGYLKKDFGADSFYSNLYPHEEEHTDTRFLNLKTTIDKGCLTIKPLIFYRRHRDKYILDRNRPWWYVNFHTTYTYGTEVQAEFDLDDSFLIIGLEAREEKITSTNLGHHARKNTAVFSAYNLELKSKGRLNASLRGDYFEDWGWEVLPSFSGSYFLKPGLKFRGAVNRLFRIPSYTELYYESPANKGNGDLVPEEGFSYEVGLDYMRGRLRSSMSFFLRKEENVVDWVRQSLKEPWQAQNVNSLKTRGIETELMFETPLSEGECGISSVYAGYGYIYTTHSPLAAFAKYSPDYLRHQAHTGLNLELPFDVRQTLRLNYEERINQRHYFLLDSKISKRIEKNKMDIELFVSATNLLNTSYSEIGGVAMPGRWVEAGFSIEF